MSIAYYPLNIYTAGLCMRLIAFVCVCVCNQKNIYLHTYRSNVFAKRTHSDHSSTLYFTRDVFSSIQSYRGCYSPYFYSRDCPSGVSGDLSKHGKRNLHSFEIVTPTVWLNPLKPTPTCQCIEIAVLHELSVQHSPLTVLSAHRVCVLWNPSYKGVAITVGTLVVEP